ncbi:helix-turn-helix transcriptional regulator [Streptomyces sp. GbtcB6]|uniref:helix-turn-helix domain-containing protein n=1 Tax=Streptomyces sp. GbtcB6 TaxID=2824751 RepID=UPI0027E3CE68|nr:helix-turn-helix transcriptional regulator [Streptomyces sp. GbtcB6]
MPGATETEATEAFALLLRELKDRSGLSYGALAKRLHMSTSTLHRYCNGTAVPVEYAPVERLARVCRATPQELVELHRRWILADAARGSRGEQATAPDTAPAADPGSQAAQAAQATQTTHGPGEGEGEGEGGEPVVVDLPREPVASRRRRTVLIASVAVAAVLGAVVLAARLPLGGGNGGAGDRRAAGDTGTITGTLTGTADTGKTSASPSPTAKGHRPSASASATPTGSGDAKQGSGAQGTGGTTTGAAVPLTVNTRPYVYDDPCSQHFLVDSEPAQVGPPANEQDAPRWAAAYGAVSSGEQEVALTVQGTGEETVVLEALHVRVLSKGAPLAWNDYSMGVGCGGGVGTKSFDIDLDNGSPTVTAKNGQRDLPYKVSESDPEVFYVFARTEAHDVRWDLTLDWSSGSRHGTVRIDNAGAAFRTSADAGRPGYDYPLGGGEWIEREG